MSCEPYVTAQPDDAGNWDLGLIIPGEENTPRPGTVTPDYKPGTVPNADMVADVAPWYDGCEVFGWDTEAGAAAHPVFVRCPPGEEQSEQNAIDWATAMASEYQRLALTPSTINYQPNGDWALVSMDFIVMTDPAPQLSTTELFGYTITVRSTPALYEWDFGDGTIVSTSDPGQPYPNQTIAHVYSQSADAVTLSLTTSWRGEFQIEGSTTWIPIAGLANTTATAGPVEIVAMEVRLVPNPD